MTISKLKGECNESALLRFLENQNLTEEEAQSVTNGIGSVSELWLLAKMAKAVRKTAL